MKIPDNIFVIVTTAVGMLSNPFKDFNTLYKAYINILKKQEQFLLIVIGDKQTNFKTKLFRKIPFANPIPQSQELIDYYSCADLYIQSSNIET